MPTEHSLRSHRLRIKGVPYAQAKVTGNVAGCAEWTKAIEDQTRAHPKILGPCLLRVTFRLPPDKFPPDNPYGNDLDNLLKRFCDALGKTVFAKAPGRDGCVVALEASKVKVADAMQ